MNKQRDQKILFYLIDKFACTSGDLNYTSWLDANDASTITTVSGAVSEWGDKSGNNRHVTQTTGANRPVVSLVRADK